MCRFNADLDSGDRFLIDFDFCLNDFALEKVILIIFDGCIIRLCFIYECVLSIDVAIERINQN